MSWVPFIPDKDPNTDDTDVWGNAPEKLYQGASDIPILGANVTVVPFPKTFIDAVADVIEKEDKYVDRTDVTRVRVKTLNETSKIQDVCIQFNLMKINLVNLFQRFNSPH